MYKKDRICSMCDGSGLIDLGLHEDICPDCDGDGKVNPVVKGADDLAAEYEKAKEKAHRERDHSPYKLYGRVVYICPQCGVMSWWQGSATQEKELMADLRECESIVCGCCHHIDPIDQDTKKRMMS